MITMPVSESIRRIDLVSVENGARDFVYPTTDGNPNGSKIYWDHTEVASDDESVIALGCPGSAYEARRPRPAN